MTCRFGVALAAGAGALCCGIGLMATSAWLIARAAGHPPVLYLMVAIVSVRAFGLGRGVLRYAERLVAHDAALRLLARRRVQVYERLAAQAPARVWAGGESLGLLVGSVEGVADRWLRGLLPMAAAGIAGGAAVVLQWWLLPCAGAVLAGALVVGGLVAPWLAWRTGVRAERRAAAARAELAGRTADLLRGLPELIVYGAVPDRLGALRRVDAEVTAAGERSAWTAGFGSGLTTLAAGAAVLGALAVGVPAVRGGELGPVLLGVLVLTPLAAFEAVGALSSAALSLLRAREDDARVRAVLDAPDCVAEPVSPSPLPAGIGLRIRGLRARWPGAAQDALDGLDLDVPAGGRITVTGRSGVGKSTLAAVLMRFLDYEGSVSLGGVELRDLAADDVRRVIGLCAQDAYLFDTTVAENVRLAKPGASDGEVTAVLVRAGLGDWLGGLAAGLQTPVGEHGAAVSGGERQRIALARALLAGVSVLVLDEPDAHLDEDTAAAVLTDLLAAAGDRTVLLITHRPGPHLTGLVTLDQPRNR